MKVCNEIQAGVAIWFLFANAMSAMTSIKRLYVTMVMFCELTEWFISFSKQEQAVSGMCDVMDVTLQLPSRCYILISAHYSDQQLTMLHIMSV